MWGWNKGPSVDRSFAKLSLLFLWSDNCPFIDPPFYITVALQQFLILVEQMLILNLTVSSQYSSPSQRTSAWIWTVIEHPRFFHEFLSIYLGPSLSSLKNVIPPIKPSSTLYYIWNQKHDTSDAIINVLKFYFKITVCNQYTSIVVFSVC